MSKRTVLFVAALAILIPLAVGAQTDTGNQLVAAFSEWVAQQEQADSDLAARVADLEDRVAELESRPAPTTTTTTTTPAPPPTTTTTTQPSGSLTPSGPITVTQSNTVIEGRHFTGSSGDCVRIQGAANVTIRNSTFTNCHKAVYAVNASNVRVENIRCEADMSNRGRNCVQFDKVTGGHVINSTSINTNGGTLAEDHISIYQSHGTAQNPILVENNHIEGGGPSRSGSCIMTGDVGGSYQVIRGNTCINPGQVGIGVSGGTNITVDDNTVVSDSFSWTNVGIYVWRYTGSQPCHSHTVTNNQVAWFNSSGNRNSFWNGGNCGSITIVSNDVYYTP